MAGNVLRGGNKAQRVEIQGLKELERKLKALSDENPELKAAMYEPIRAASAGLRQRMVSSAHAAGWDREIIKSKFGKYAGQMTGSDVIDHIFSYSRDRGTAKSKISALVGVTKRAKAGRGTMFSWKAGKRGGGAFGKAATWESWGKSVDSGKPHRPAGTELAMSMATALEFGISTRPAHPAIRAAVESSKSQIIATISDKWRELLERFGR